MTIKPNHMKIAIPLPVMNRNPRTSIEPQIHYGLIASDNTVVNYAAFRTALAEDLDALCVEREGAGLMDHFKRFVISGICDCCESHRNEKWQRYAAMTVAASAKELPSIVPPQEVTLELPRVPVAGMAILYLNQASRILQMLTHRSL